MCCAETKTATAHPPRLLGIGPARRPKSRDGQVVNLTAQIARNRSSLKMFFSAGALWRSAKAKWVESMLDGQVPAVRWDYAS